MEVNRICQQKHILIIIFYDTTTKQYDVVRYDYNAIACYDVYDSLFNKVPVFNNLMACIEYIQSNFDDLYQNI